MIIETREEWFAEFHAHWDDLNAIVNRYTKYGALFAALKDSNDLHRLRDILEEAWARAPDSSMLSSIPSWGVLCDLCSEGAAL